MISIKDFQSHFLDYAARNQLWNQMQFEHSEDELNDLMLLIIDGEQRLLEMFGLPGTLQFSETLQLYALKQGLTLLDVKTLYEQLKEAAEEYLLAPLVTDIVLLNEAQEKKLYIDEVLPQISLKLKAEPYYLYLYYEFLLEYKISPQLFLEEVKLVQQNNLSQRLHELSKSGDWHVSECYHELAGYGLMYLERFLSAYTSFEIKFYLNA